MIKWAPFIYQEKVYDLTHLHPKQIEYKHAATDEKPEKIYRVQLIYGLHCFTRSKNNNKDYDKNLFYADGRETRIFDFERHKLSKNLPGIIENLTGKKCYHTNKGNFLIIDNNIAIPEYEVYFQVSRSLNRGLLSLFVQSAYIRDQGHSGSSQKKSIKFEFILNNIMINKKIKIPK